MVFNRVSTSPTEAVGSLFPPTGKISSSTDPPPAAGPLALLVEATEQSNYLPDDSPAQQQDSAPAQAPTPKAEEPAVPGLTVAPPATAAESIPQDVAFSPSHQDNRIPKKNSLPAPIGTLDGFQLPPGVVLPDSVTPEILAGKPMRMLFELPQKAMVEALAEFDAAVKERGSEIRSLPAYLVGVIKRYKTIQQASQGGAGMLSDRVMARLDRLVSSGYCSQTEIDDGIKNKLAMMTENEGLSAIEELCQIKREDIRSFSSYFMGILNRYANNRNMINQIAQGQNNQRNNRWGNTQNKGSGGHSGGSDKFSHYGRQDGKSDRHGKDGSSRSGGGRRRSRSRSRSRSRDRDRRRRRHRSYSSSRSRSRSDSRDQYSRRRRRSRSRSRSRSRDRHDRHRDHKRSSRFGSNVSGQNAIPPPPPPRPGTMNYAPHQMAVPPPPPRAPAPAMQQSQQLVNDQQLQQLFQVRAPAPPAIPSQPTQPVQNPLPITLPSNLSQQQIQALQAILHQGPTGQQAPVPPQPQTQVQQWPAPVAAPAAPNQVDIFNLAEQAAQALSSVPSIQQTAAFPPAAMHNVQQAVTEQGLPTMVQYAIQNLRVSGHVDAALDPHVCNLLAKLPETNALLALETFASCELVKMRNKTAYLVGILKKELVKLGLS